jgi:hypothetical protein
MVVRPGAQYVQRLLARDTPVVLADDYIIPTEVDAARPQR